jgi:hypothetical protein
MALAPGRTRQQIMNWALNHDLKRTKEAKAKAQSTATKGKPKPRLNEKEGRQPATPVLNARVASRTKQQGPSPIGRMLEQMRQMLPTHPRRMAYALAARNGTGLDAYNAWKNWKPQAQAA